MDTLYLKRSLKSHCSTNLGVQYLSTSEETSSFMTSSPSTSVKRKMPNFQQCWTRYAVAVQLLKIIAILQERLFQGSIPDKFLELREHGQPLVCLFPRRKACNDFNSEMLGRLSLEVHELPCTDEVDEMCNPHKWTKKKNS